MTATENRPVRSLRDISVPLGSKVVSFQVSWKLRSDSRSELRTRISTRSLPTRPSGSLPLAKALSWRAPFSVRKP